MAIHPLADQPAPVTKLVDLPRLITAYYAEKPDPSVSTQKVSFGTSGHRGSYLELSSNENHILAITQAICEYPARTGVTGPLFLAKDTHALSEPAFCTALEVLIANQVTVSIDQDLGYAPTPALSHSIPTYNHSRPSAPADGVVTTPSHNQPQDAGFKYSPPTAGQASSPAKKYNDQRSQEWLARLAHPSSFVGCRGPRRRACQI
jgi:phosphoglucomutase